MTQNSSERVDAPVDPPSPEAGAVSASEVHGAKTESVAEPAQGSSLNSRAKKSSVWVFSGMAGSMGMRMGSYAAMSRILSPELYGIMQLVFPVITWLNLFSDIGLKPSVVQSKRQDRVFYDTAWTVQAIRGLVLWMMTWVLAYPVSRFYDQPILMWVLPLVGLGTFLMGLVTLAMITENRKLEMKRVSLIGLGSQLVMYVVMITWALVHPTIWALAIGGVVSALFNVVAGFLFLPGKLPRPMLDRSALRELGRMGVWIFFSTICFGLASPAITSPLILGKLISKWELGLFGLAVMLSTVLPNIVQGLAQSVIFPALAETARDDVEQLAKRYAKASRRVNLLVMPVAGGLIPLGGVLVAILTDPRYLDAGWMLQIMAIYGAFDGLTLTNTKLLLALGHARTMLWINLSRVVWLAVTMPLGWWLGGLYGDPLVGILWAIGLSGLPGYALVLLGLRHQKVLHWRTEMEAWALLAAGLLAGTGVWALIEVLGLSRYW